MLKIFRTKFSVLFKIFNHKSYLQEFSLEELVKDKNGPNGQNGTDGQDGTNGQDGTDGQDDPESPKIMAGLMDDHDNPESKKQEIVEKHFNLRYLKVLNYYETYIYLAMSHCQISLLTRLTKP